MDDHRQQPRPVAVPLDSNSVRDIIPPKPEFQRSTGPASDHRQQPRPVVSCLDSADIESKHSDQPKVIKYSSNDLKALRPASLNIHRDVRKKLFQHRIWKPRKDKFFNIPVIVNNRRPGKLLRNSTGADNIVIKPISHDCQPTLKFKVCCLNAQSVVNKTDSLSDFISTNDFDLIALTETWLQEETPQSVIRDLVPDNYSIKHVPRPGTRRGGGVGVIYKSSIDIATLPSMDSFKSFEHLGIKINAKNKDVTIYVIYRPPPSQANGLTEADFQEDWSNFVAGQCVSANPVIIMGDLNVQLDVISRPSTIAFNDVINAAGFTQHVQDPTHKHGHILDVVITREDDPQLTNLQVLDPGICNRHNVTACDHKAIVFHINIRKPLPTRRTVTFRRLNRIPPDIFREDLASKITSTGDSDQTKLTIYHDILNLLVDKHAPSVTKTIVVRNNIPYYTQELYDAKRIKRQHERRWRKTQDKSHLELYRLSASKANKLLRQAKANYYSGVIDNHSNDIKTLFKVTNKLLGKSDSSPLPTGFTASQLAEEFSNFFINKVQKIRQSFNDSPSKSGQGNVYPTGKSTLAFLTPASSTEVAKIIANSPSKSCVLDPLPTKLLKQCLGNGIILKFVTEMINESVTNVFPDALKSAVITPLLKKSTLDACNFKNFRPVSNLSFISKVVEKVVASRLKCHLTENDLLDTYQSAYRSKHSTETALIKVQNDIIMALDNKKAVALVLLDLSAAFDTIDHLVLINRLKNCLGVTDQALSWFKSYLSNRTSSVMVSGERSTAQPLNIGVPQGSVLGPILFTCYTIPLGQVIAKHGLQRHLYADDTQMYISFDQPTDMDATLDTLENCLEDVRTWMHQNFLKLNDEKTEFMILSKKQCSMDSPVTIKMGQSTVRSVDKVKNLGVIFDNNLTMECQIANIRKQCFHQIYNIAHIRRYLSHSAIRTLVQANITSRLDYANGLLYGLPQKDLTKLQTVQNTAARLIVKASRRAHITPILLDLHWLPVEYRIRYKILTLTYKSIHQQSPPYLQNLIKHRTSSRTLRSNSKRLLVQPAYNLKSYGLRSFQVAAAAEWNILPDYVRYATSLDSFKSSLKTHFFKKAYKL